MNVFKPYCKTLCLYQETKGIKNTTRDETKLKCVFCLQQKVKFHLTITYPPYKSTK